MAKTPQPKTEAGTPKLYNPPKSQAKEPKPLSSLLSVRKPGHNRWVFGKPNKSAPPIVYKIPPEMLSEFLQSGLSPQQFLESKELIPQEQAELQIEQMPAPRSLKMATNRDKTERLACEWMADHLGGQLEFSTPVGRIDVLTESKVYEVKQARNWKHALGQVLAYGHYFPDRQKTVVLVGKAEDFMPAAAFHCDLFGVDVVDFNSMA